jgi:hypothetical protein
MSGLLNKVWLITILVFSLLSCRTKEQILSCTNRNAHFSVLIPIAERGDAFEFVGEQDNGSVLFFKNSIDSIELRIISNFLNPEFYELYDIKAYPYNYLHQATNIKLFDIPLEKKFYPDRITDRYILFNWIENHQWLQPHYEVTYIFSEVTANYDIRVNIIKRFPFIDLKTVLEWIKYYDRILIKYR